MSDRRKTCRICKQDMHISNYRRHSSYADGFESACKMCVYQNAKKPPKPDPVAGLMRTWKR